MFIPLSFLLLLSVLSFTLASPAPTIVSSSLYLHLSKGTIHLHCVEILQICLVEETLNNGLVEEIIDDRLVEEIFYDCLIEELTSDRLIEEVSSNRLVKAVLSYRLTEDNLETRLFKDSYSRLFRGTIYFSPV
ncbi:hypothetical protein D6C97_00870 [Aureobasidium pullulans]|nr:hypothetical protein D6C97_00870 [Aureobasidium pullulans]